MEKPFGFGSSSRTHLFIQITFILVALVMVSRILTLLIPLLIPLLIAFILAYVCNPFVSMLARKKVPRTVGILILLLLFVLFVFVFVLLVVPLLAEQFDDFIKKIPMYTGVIKTWLIPRIEGMLDTTLPNASEMLATATDRFGSDLAKLADAAAMPLREVATFAAAGTFFLFSLVVTVFIIPFFLFFMLRDFDRFGQLWTGLVPPRHHSWMRELMQDLDHTMSGWLRGQLLVMLILGTLYSIGYTWVGITLSLFIGLLTGFLAFIPYVGAVMGFFLALIMAILDGQGWGPILGVCSVFGFVQLLDAFLITPNILGKSVGLHPAVVVCSLMAFGALWGFWGALIAVPTSAMLAVITRHLMKSYKQSAFFQRLD